jgi:hypothetical protein
MCYKELPIHWFEDMCEECMNNLASSIIHTDEIFPNEDDFI